MQRASEMQHMNQQQQQSLGSLGIASVVLLVPQKQLQQCFIPLLCCCSC
jgi:hypothetical protein